MLEEFGLTICVDSPTPGDGNCFLSLSNTAVSSPYHAYNKRNINLIPLKTYKHGIIQQDYNYIQQYHAIYELTLNEEHDHLSWLYEQSRNDTYYGVIHNNWLVLIFVSRCTRESPFNKITSTWNRTITWEYIFNHYCHLHICHNQVIMITTHL